MTAPAPRRRAFRRDQAEVGVGTLIVFIAMVLVAAVAAAVIIGTTGTLQQRAQATGMEATQEVSSNLLVTGITGVRNSTADDIWTVRVALTLSAGSESIDLNQTIIRFNDGDRMRTFRHAADEDGFNLTWIRGAGTSNVAERGDLVEIEFNLTDRELEPREQFDLQLIQAVGAPVVVDVRTPSTYSTDLYVTLG